MESGEPSHRGVDPGGGGVGLKIGRTEHPRLDLKIFLKIFKWRRHLE